MTKYLLNKSEDFERKIRSERQKARELRKSAWWLQKIEAGKCAHCGKVVGKKNLTMDHLVPLARGGLSAKSNIVAACFPCNQEKGLDTPVDKLFEILEEEKKRG